MTSFGSVLTYPPTLQIADQPCCTVHFSKKYQSHSLTLGETVCWMDEQTNKLPNIDDELNA